MKPDRGTEMNNAYKNACRRIGGTPLEYFGERGDARIWIKNEGVNLTSSLKDRSAMGILDGLMARNELPEGATLLDTSSGSFACSLATLGSLLGHKVTVVVNEKISKTNEIYLKEIGATIIRHGRVTGEGIDYCMDLMAKDPGKYVFTNQLNNWDSVKAHRESTGPEIEKAMSTVVAVIGSMGSGATLLGVSEYFAKKNLPIKIFGSIGVPGDEAKVAGTFREDADFRSPFIRKLLDGEQRLIEPIEVYWQAAMDNVSVLLRKGILVGPQAGGVLAATFNAIDRYRIAGDVVAIAGDSFLKNTDRFI